jgi:hypothetical protein
MRIIWITLLLASIYECYGQSASEEGMRIKLSGKIGEYYTEYSVLIIDNEQFFDGPYKIYYSKRQLKDSCYFEKGIKIGKEIFYDKRGRITFIHEYVGKSFPRTIKTKAYYYSGACRYAEGNMKEEKSGKAYNNGIDKFYWKNMQTMDSVIYDQGKMVYRAIFNKKGELVFEKSYD